MERRSHVRRAAAALVLTLTAVTGASSSPAEAISNDVVISQVYGGGGNSGATLTNDFVELFNRGSSPVSVDGWTVQYASAAGTSWQRTTLSGTIQPGTYYLVQQAAGSGGTTPLPTPDAAGSIAMSASSGKVALVADLTLLTGSCPSGTVDVVGFGTADCFEGTSAAPSLNNTTAAIRADGGCTETDQNGTDFTTGAPAPRNSSSPTNVCAPSSPVLVINEIDYDQPGTDAAEFVEITNTGDAAADLSAVQLEFVNGTGGGATVYNTIQLGGTLAPGDHYVVCANAATVANCDLDDAPDTNFIQNGAPDAVALLVDGVIVDTVSYEGDTGAPYTEGSGTGLEDSTVAGIGISRCPDGEDTDRNNADFVPAAITPGEPTSPTCGLTYSLISTVQGAGASVATPGIVSVDAIVTADYQSSDQLRGFFIQEEDADGDGDAATSEGIFVFCSGCPVDVSVGDRVSVTGNANEFFGMSQISATLDTDITVLSSGNPLPSPTDVDLPASGSTRDAATFEAVEGMIVEFTDTLVVSEYFELARYGQLVLTAGERPRQFTDSNEPDIAGYAAFLDDLNRNRIILDDDNNIQNDAIGTVDEPYFWPRPGLSNDNLVRGGDSIDDLTGVLHWSFAGQAGTDAWRVRPVEEVFDYSFTSNNPRTDAPDEVGGSFKVASFNVLNYFTTIDARGADSQRELDRQREKIASAICALDADVVGLIEIENNGPVAIGDLLNGTNGVNANCGEYAFIDTGVVGTDEITTAFVYRTTTATPIGDFAVLDSSVDARFNDERNRPALAQTFVETATGGEVTVVVNHLKSKGSSCADIGDSDVADGQGNCNVTRAAAAAAMVDWLATDPTGAGTNNVLIIGDLNAYRNEDPIDAIEAGADDVASTADDYTDLLDSLIGPSAYSYVFDGQLGYLDHALAGAGIVGEVTGVTVWHINADEIPVFDYNDEIRDGSAEASFERESGVLPIYEPNPYRSSDHDPVIVGLDLNAPPVCTAAAPSIDTLLTPNHKMVAVDVLGVTDPEGDSVTITIDSVFQDEPVNGGGDGNTAPDADGVGTSTASVRAERSGEGDGRVYHIGFTATDTFDNRCSGEVLVSVPLSRSGVPAVDGGALYDATEMA